MRVVLGERESQDDADVRVEWRVGLLARMVWRGSLLLLTFGLLDGFGMREEADLGGFPFVVS